jgi:predicted negative regulator of RcsB-dependent stress response
MVNDMQKINFTDKAIHFTRHNLKIFVSIFVSILILFLSFFFFKNLQEKNSIKIADQYTQASILVKQKKILESKLLLESIISENHQFYSPMALYLIIDNNIVSEKLKIISFFDKILNNNSIGKENLNLIKIKKAIYLIGLDNEKLIIETLNPIINSNSVWRNIAINLISEYFMSKNQIVKAKEYIQLLNKNNNK